MGQDSLKDEDPPENSSDFSATQDSSESLRNRLKVLEAENALLKAKYAIGEEASDGTQFQHPLEGDRIINSDLPASGSSSSLLESSSSFLEQSTSSTSALEQSEGRIAGLLSVKDRLVTVQEEKSRLEADVSVLEEELETLAAASRTLTACTVLPLIVLIIAIVTAFLPLVSQLFGTRDF